MDMLYTLPRRVKTVPAIYVQARKDWKRFGISYIPLVVVQGRWLKVLACFVHCNAEELDRWNLWNLQTGPRSGSVESRPSWSPSMIGVG